MFVIGLSPESKDNEKVNVGIFHNLFWLKTEIRKKNLIKCDFISQLKLKFMAILIIVLSSKMKAREIFQILLFLKFAKVGILNKVL